MKTAYPTATDVENFIEAGGLTLTAAQQGFCDEAAAAGRQIIEQRCGRQFLGSGSNSTRYFDPPTNRNGRLRLDDLASLNTVQYQPYNTTAETLTITTDFWTLPDNASSKSLPITALQFRTRRWAEPIGSSLRQSIIVNGQWGWGTLAVGFPETVWTAMLAAGCLEVYEIIAQGLTGGLLSWREADVQEDYGVEPLARLKKSWEQRVETAVRLYRRWEI